MTDSSNGLTNTLQTVQTGDGDNSPLQMSLTQVNISGSLTVNGSPISVDTGSLVTTSSFNAYTSSVNTHLAGLDVETGSLQNQINGLATTSSLTSLSSSIAVTDLNQNNVIAGLATTGSLSGYTTVTTFNNYTGSNDARVNSLISQTGSYVTETESGSFVTNVAGGPISFEDQIIVTKGNGSTSTITVNNVTNADSSSFSQYAVSASYAPDISNRNGLINTGSLGGSQSITGSLNVEGTLTATSASITYLETVYETASIIYSSGSNQLGDASDDIQTLWGKVSIPSGPVSITGSLNASGSQHTIVGKTLITGSLIVSSSATYDIELTGSMIITRPVGSNSANNLFVTNSNGAATIGATTILSRLGNTTTGTVGTLSGYYNSNRSLATNDELGFTIDPTTSAISGGTGNVIYTNDPTDSFPAMINFQNKATWTDGRITLLKNTDITGSLNVTGDITATNFTGSLQGTASYATNANSASFAPTIIPDWVATTGSNTFTGRQTILNDLEINSSNPIGTFVSIISTGTTSFLMDSPLTQFQSNGEMLFKNTISSTGSADINFRTENGGDITFNTNNSGSIAVTGSVNISGSLSINGTTRLNTILPNVVKQNFVMLGGDNTISSSTIYNNYLNAITTSLSGNDVNLVMPPGGGILGPSGLANLTGSIFISGSNNVILNLGSQIPVAQGRRQIVGSGNILVTTPNINTSSLTIPQINNNYNAGGLNITLTTGSALGNSAHSFAGNVNLGTLIWNHPSASIASGINASSVNNNVIVGSIQSTTIGPTLLTSSAQLSNNIVSNVGVTLNHISSSINFSQNIVGGNGLTVNNRYYQTGSNNTLAATANIFGGQVITINAGGSPATNVARTLVGNIIGGQTVNVSLEQNNTDTGGLRNSIVYGQGLNVSGSHSAASTAQNNITLLGRWNTEDSGLADSARTVFAVGTGTANGNRRTGLYVTSGSLVGVSGSFNVNGNSTFTGSVTVNGTTSLSGSSPLRVGTYNNEGVIQTLGGSQWLYRNSDTYNTVVGNASGVNNGFFTGSEKNMIFNGFNTPFTTGSNNVIIQGAGDNFISGSNNIFLGSHNGQAGGSNNLLLGSTSYSSGSIFDNKFELGTVSTSRIFHKQGTDPLQIGDDTQITGSLYASGSSADHSIIGNQINIIGNTQMSGNSGFPLYVDGTINSKRLHFNNNPFNSNLSNSYYG